MIFYSTLPFLYSRCRKVSELKVNNETFEHKYDEKLTEVRRAGGLGFLTKDGLGSRNYMLQLTLILSQWTGVKSRKHVCWVWSMGCDAVLKFAGQ